MRKRKKTGELLSLQIDAKVKKEFDGDGPSNATI